MQRNILVRERTGLEKATDLEVIERMALGDLDEGKSNEAFAEFHRRYAVGLFSTCRYVCRMLPNPDDVAADLTEDVLIRAFAYSNSYNANRASIKTWLNRIAQNEFNDYYKEFRRNHPTISEEKETESNEVDLDLEDEAPFDRSKINGERLEIALGILDSMERDILMTHMIYKDIDNLDSQIPANIMKELCQIYKKKPNSIRKLKSRAMAKIKTFILRE